MSVGARSLTFVLMVAACSGKGPLAANDLGLFDASVVDFTIPPPACDGGTSLCSGACVDETSDPFNCGACDTTCPSGQVCTSGKCVVGMTGCRGFVLCINVCKTADCVQACYDNTTTMGQTFVDALLGCMDMNCPSTGGVCDPMKAMEKACAECYTAVQMMNGACYQQRLDCNSSLP